MSPMESESGWMRGARQVVLLALLSMAVFLPRAARAQVSLDQFRPAPLASDGFALSRPVVLRHAEWGVQVVGDYAHDPLVVSIDQVHQKTQVLHIVRNHLVLHAGAALGLGTRLTVFGMLPVHVIMDGEDTGTYGRDADGAGIGDATAGGRLLLTAPDARRFGLTLEFLAHLPTAELANGKQTYSGDRIGSYEPAAIGELRFDNFEIRLRVGARLRREVVIGDLELGQELVYGLGARYKVSNQLYLHAEAYGASNIKGFSDRDRTPVELLVGPKYQTGDWFFGAAAGPGLVAGYGSPDVRVVASAGYAAVVKPAPKDTDKDGLVDPKDACPLQPEDRDGFEDAEGCPDPDNDKDGVLDVSDRCAMIPEDADAFADADGCPDPDNDNDGLLDTVDQCPLEPEDKDAFEDGDGCPDPDNDKDGILDVNDACPLVPGVPEEKGCPPVQKLEVEGGQLKILDRVVFANDADVILPVSEPILELVRSTLESSPELKRIRIEGHTDAMGRSKRNLDLSKRRARSVGRWLVEHGIAVERLEAWGCGETYPIADNESETGRQENRRVEFHVINPAPEGLKRPKTCEPLPIE